MREDMKIPFPKDRKVYLSGMINEERAHEVIKQIIEIRQADQELAFIHKQMGGNYIPNPIELYISSFGGGVYQFLGIVAVMEAKDETPVDTYCFSYAMSGGFIVFISGATRHATRHTTFMTHLINNMTMGNLNELIIDVKECVRLQNIMEDIILRNTKIQPAILRKKHDKGDWFIAPMEAKKLGIVDGWLVTNQPETKRKTVTPVATSET